MHACVYVCPLLLSGTFTFAWVLLAYFLAMNFFLRTDIHIAVFIIFMMLFRSSFLL